MYTSCIHILMSASPSWILAVSESVIVLTAAARPGAPCRWHSAAGRPDFGVSPGNREIPWYSMGTLGHRAGLLLKSEMLLMIWGPLCHLSILILCLSNVYSCHCMFTPLLSDHLWVFFPRWMICPCRFLEKIQLPMVQIWPVEVKTPCGSMQTSPAHKADFAIGTGQN